MTPEEQLAYERQIAAVLEIRAQKKQASSTLSMILNSSVVVAVVGFLGTGIIGGQIQNRAKENDLDRAAQEKRMTAQDAATTKVLELAGAFASGTDDALTTAREVYADERYTTKDEKKQNTDWKTRIRAARDAVDGAWRREKQSLRYTLIYLFDGHAEIGTALDRLATASEAFERCTREWYLQVPEKGSPLSAEQVCPAERDRFRKATEDFANTAATHRVTRK